MRESGSDCLRTLVLCTRRVPAGRPRLLEASRSKEQLRGPARRPRLALRQGRRRLLAACRRLVSLPACLGQRDGDPGTARQALLCLEAAFPGRAPPSSLAERRGPAGRWRGTGGFRAEPAPSARPRSRAPTARRWDGAGAGAGARAAGGAPAPRRARARGRGGAGRGAGAGGRSVRSRPSPPHAPPRARGRVLAANDGPRVRRGRRARRGRPRPAGLRPEGQRPRARPAAGEARRREARPAGPQPAGPGRRHGGARRVAQRPDGAASESGPYSRRTRPPRAVGSPRAVGPLPPPARAASPPTSPAAARPASVARGSRPRSRTSPRPAARAPPAHPCRGRAAVAAAAAGPARPRRAAVRRLPQLLRLSASDEWHRRAAACKGLAEVVGGRTESDARDGPAAEGVSPVVPDALSAAAAEKVARALSKRVEDQHYRVRQAALRAVPCVVRALFAASESSLGIVLPTVLRQLAAPKRETQQLASAALRRSRTLLGPAPLLPALITALSGGKPRAQTRCLEASMDWIGECDDALSNRNVMKQLMARLCACHGGRSVELRRAAAAAMLEVYRGGASRMLAGTPMLSAREQREVEKALAERVPDIARAMAAATKTSRRPLREAQGPSDGAEHGSDDRAGDDERGGATTKGRGAGDPAPTLSRPARGQGPTAPRRRGRPRPRPPRRRRPGTRRLGGYPVSRRAVRPAARVQRRPGPAARRGGRGVGPGRRGGEPRRGIWNFPKFRRGEARGAFPRRRTDQRKTRRGVVGRTDSGARRDVGHRRRPRDDAAAARGGPRAHRVCARRIGGRVGSMVSGGADDGDGPSAQRARSGAEGSFAPPSQGDGGAPAARLRRLSRRRCGPNAGPERSRCGARGPRAVGSAHAPPSQPVRQCLATRATFRSRRAQRKAGAAGHGPAGAGAAWAYPRRRAWDPPARAVPCTRCSRRSSVFFPAPRATLTLSAG